jgi:hypothetical protein
MIVKANNSSTRENPLLEAIELSLSFRQSLSRNPGFPVETGTQFINMVPRLCGDKSGCSITDFGHDKNKKQQFMDIL